MKEILKNILKTGNASKEENAIDVKEYTVGMLAVLFSIIIAWFMIPGIVSFMNPSVDMSAVKDIFYQPENAFPEPVENRMFMLTVFIMPFLLLAFVFLFNYILKNSANVPVIEHLHDVLFAFFLGFIACLTWIANQNNRFFLFQNSIGLGLGTIFFVAFISLLINMLVLYPQKNRIADIFLFLTKSACWLSILSVVLLCVYGISMASEMGTHNWHFNIVFHSVVQVFLGKQLLYDFFNKYGLYPYILEPIWRIIGLNVFKFTMVMGSLMGISLVLLYMLFKKLVDNKIIGCLGLLSLIWINYLFARVIFMHLWDPGYIEPYFQFWPIRFIFPMVSLYLTYQYFKTSSKKIYYLSFVIYPVSMIWNFDTGFVIYLTWLITLIYEGLCDRDIKKIFSHLAHWISFLLIIIGLFVSYMYLRYGHFPVYGKYLMTQKMFYIYGYAMMSMPLIHPWNLVVLVYIAGMTIALINLLNGNRSLKVFMIFNLTILGTGIFSYYQGRSHDFNLTPICYPAIILLTVFADGLINKIRNNKSILKFMALNFITFFMVYSSMCLIRNSEIIFTTIRKRLAVSIKGESTSIIRSAEFIKNNTQRGEEVLMLSNFSGVYCLESRTTSPITVEPTNIITVGEVNEVLDYLKSSSCRKVIMDVNFKEKIIWDFVQANFKLSLVNPDKNIGIFVK